MKKWEKPSLQVLDISMTMKFWPPKHDDDGPKDPGAPGDPGTGLES